MCRVNPEPLRKRRISPGVKRSRGLVFDRRNATKRVLIVDQSEDTREVLRTVLQRQGVQIYEAREGLEGLDLARQCHPDVMVLDLDTINPLDVSVCNGFDLQAREENSVVLLLGSVRSWRQAANRANVVAKPYHYGPLVRKIESLLHQAGVGEGESPD